MAVLFNPQDILARFTFEGTEWIGDFGAGSGNWTIPLAKRVKEGKVFAIDVQEEPLEVLKRRAEREGLRNVEIIRADLEKPLGSTLSSEILDWVFVVHTLFQIEKKDLFLQEAWRVLKKEGRLFVLDWKKESIVGPSQGRVSEKELVDMTDKIGFDKEEIFYPDQYHYAILFLKR